MLLNVKLSQIIFPTGQVHIDETMLCSTTDWIWHCRLRANIPVLRKLLSSLLWEPAAKWQEQCVITASSALSEHPVTKTPKWASEYCDVDRQTSWWSHCWDNQCLCLHAQRIPFLTQLFMESGCGSTHIHHNYVELIFWWLHSLI